MVLWDFLKARASSLVLGTVLVGVAAYEWREVRRGEGLGVSAARAATPGGESPATVRAEGRVVTYPGAEVTVSAEIGGKLTKLVVNERDRVTAGQVIAELDVKEQRAALQEAWARVKEAEQDIDYFRRERTRSQQLFASQVVAESVLDRTVHELRAAETRRASLVASAARLNRVVDKARLVAPIDGTVTLRNADAGEMLAAGDAIVTIADLSRQRIEAEVGEFDTSRVRVGAEAQIRAEGFEGVFRGVVEELPDQVVPRRLKPLDPSRPVDTRVLLAKIRLLEPVPFKLGQRVDVELR